MLFVSAWLRVQINGLGEGTAGRQHPLRICPDAMKDDSTQGRITCQSGPWPKIVWGWVDKWMWVWYGRGHQCLVFTSHSFLPSLTATATSATGAESLFLGSGLPESMKDSIAPASPISDKVRGFDSLLPGKPKITR